MAGGQPLAAAVPAPSLRATTGTIAAATAMVSTAVPSELAQPRVDADGRLSRHDPGALDRRPLADSVATHHFMAGGAVLMIAASSFWPVPGAVCPPHRRDAPGQGPSFQPWPARLSRHAGPLFRLPLHVHFVPRSCPFSSSPSAFRPGGVATTTACFSPERRGSAWPPW